MYLRQNDLYCDILCIYGVVSRVNGPPPMVWGGGVGTRIRYTHCISTLCRLSTLPQYYKPPPHHRGGGESYTLPQYHKPPPHHRGGGESFTTTPHGGGGGGGPANTAPYIGRQAARQIHDPWASHGVTSDLSHLSKSRHPVPLKPRKRNNNRF